MKMVIKELKLLLEQSRLQYSIYRDTPMSGIASEFAEKVRQIEEAISILNVEIRESCKEFCTCGHYGIDKVKYCSKCGKEVRLPLQNSLERT